MNLLKLNIVFQLMIMLTTIVIRQGNRFILTLQAFQPFLNSFFKTTFRFSNFNYYFYKADDLKNYADNNIINYFCPSENNLIINSFNIIHAAVTENNSEEISRILIFCNINKHFRF